MKVATQSSTYPGSLTLYGARNAVDRNPLTCMRADEIGRTYPEKTVWWKVDLGRVHNIYSIDIIFKNYNDYGMLYTVLLFILFYSERGTS